MHVLRPSGPPPSPCRLPGVPLTRHSPLRRGSQGASCSVRRMTTRCGSGTPQLVCVPVALRKGNGCWHFSGYSCGERGQSGKCAARACMFARLHFFATSCCIVTEYSKDSCCCFGFFCLSFLFSRTFPGFPHAFPAFAHSASSSCNFFLGGWNQKKLAQGVFPLLLCPNPNMPGAVSRGSPRHRGLRPHVPRPQVPRVVLRSGGPHPPLLRPASGGGGKPAHQRLTGTNGYGVLSRL